MWVSDNKGTVIRTNKALCKLLNLSDNQIIGKYNVFNDQNLIEQDVMHLIKRVFSQKTPQRFVIPWHASKADGVDFTGGNNLWIDVTLFPILNDDQQLMNVVCQWVDVTEREKAEEALKKAHKKLQEVNKNLEHIVDERTKGIQIILDQKDEFINQLGHDLKNPLGPLINLLPILEENEKDPKNKEILKVINRNVSYMKNLVTRTIQLAQLRSPNCNLHYETVNLKEEINEILQTDTMLFDEKNIQIFNNIQEDLLLTVDKIRIHEVFHNILNNAVNYSDKKEGEITIDEAQNDEDFIIISINDNGIGMTKEQLGMVFNEFYKADSSLHDFESSDFPLFLI
jgi:PAS domain S-box-containing protein